MHHRLCTTVHGFSIAAAAALLAACGGGDDAPAAGSGSTPVTAAPLVISAATPGTLNGTLDKAAALFEAGSSNATLTTFNTTDDHCRVAAYSVRNSGNGQNYFIEVSFRKDNKAVGLLKFGNDSAGSVALVSASGPLASVSVDTANRRIGFTATALSGSGTTITLNGSLEYPTNAVAANQAACG